MAVSTAGTKLYYSADGTTYTHLVDIISYPDMGTTPSKLDTTRFVGNQIQNLNPRIAGNADLIFECNYDKTKYTMISELTGNQHFKLEFGEDGADGILKWQGEIAVYVNGGGVDEVRRMTVVCSASTPIILE